MKSAFTKAYRFKPRTFVSSGVLDGLSLGGAKCIFQNTTKKKIGIDTKSADQNKCEKNGQHAAGSERDLRILLRCGHKKVK